jgi:hypothetical protein
VSNAIFPILSGEGWPVKRSPKFSTIVLPAASGQHVRIPNYPFPLPEYEVPFNMLTPADLQTLWGFYQARLGPYDSFLYWDPTDCYTVANAINAGLTVTSYQNLIPGVNGAFPAGDGTTKTFQLYRALGGTVQPVFDVNGLGAPWSTAGATGPSYIPPMSPPVAVWFVTSGPTYTPVLYDDATYGWTVSVSTANAPGGVLTFAAAPPSGVGIAVDFAYFIRVHFQEDTVAFTNFADGFFEASSVKFEWSYS